MKTTTHSAKLFHSITPSGKYPRKILNALQKALRNHPYLSAFTVCIVYLCVFQFGFVHSGDTWAETFYEYIHGAMLNGMSGFLDRGIAGYFNFLPKLFSYGYVRAGLPLGQIDHFLRIIVILYAVGCASYIAHRHNRYLIRSDGLRLALSLLTLLTYYHITSFSFINIWYIGFIPMILVSLNPNPFRKEWHQVAYAAFAMSICLTKPSVIMLPLVLYRSIRLKEWLLGFIIVFAIGLQSFVFLTSPYYLTGPHPAHVGLINELINSTLYIGLLALKLFRLAPWNLAAIVLSCLILATLLILTTRKIIGGIRTILLAITALLASYSAIYAPDTDPLSVRLVYRALFYDQMKLQREVLISFLVLLVIFLAIHYLHERIHIKRRVYVVCALVAMMTIGMYRHIDTRSAGLYINVDPFRSSLTARTPLCMPVAPTPAWVPLGAKEAPSYPWYYESGEYGSCERTNYSKTIHYAANHEIDGGVTIESAPPAGQGKAVALLLPIINPDPGHTTALALEDRATGKIYYAPLDAKTTGQKLSFVAFNLSGEAPAINYKFILRQVGTPRSHLRIVNFTDGSLANYAYFLQ